MLGGGGGNRTRVQGFADPCLGHSATPPEPSRLAPRIVGIAPHVGSTSSCVARLPRCRRRQSRRLHRRRHRRPRKRCARTSTSGRRTCGAIPQPPPDSGVPPPCGSEPHSGLHRYHDRMSPAVQVLAVGAAAPAWRVSTTDIAQAWGRGRDPASRGVCPRRGRPHPRRRGRPPSPRGLRAPDRHRRRPLVGHHPPTVRGGPQPRGARPGHRPLASIGRHPLRRFAPLRHGGRCSARPTRSAPARHGSRSSSSPTHSSPDSAPSFEVARRCRRRRDRARLTRRAPHRSSRSGHPHPSVPRPLPRRRRDRHPRPLRPDACSARRCSSPSCATSASNSPAALEVARLVAPRSRRPPRRVRRQAPRHRRLRRRPPSYGRARRHRRSGCAARRHRHASTWSGPSTIVGFGVAAARLPSR